jgi:hypothetical protein
LTGLLDDAQRFQPRGRFEGKPVRCCGRCGAGYLIGGFGKLKPVNPMLWDRMQRSWEDGRARMGLPPSKPADPAMQDG